MTANERTLAECMVVLARAMRDLLEDDNAELDQVVDDLERMLAS